MSAVSFHGWPQRYAAEADLVVDLVREVGESGEFILKSKVAALEQEIAAALGARHAVACASGTGALTLILAALGIGNGDEVVTPAFSFISSASTIALAGARPAFADVDERTFTLDPAAARAAISPSTAALLPAHLFSCMADMPTLREIADGRGLRLIEDSAVSFGAVVGGVPAGKHGDAGVFSFFPGKPLGGIGDAGMVVTDDDDLALRARVLRNHGQRPGQRFLHELVGFNCRMDELSAGYLLHVLPRHQQVLEARRERAGWYTERLNSLAPDLVLPPQDYTGRAVYTFVVRARSRTALREHLAERGIETMIYYPMPLHLQPVFGGLGHRQGEFPVAERLAQEVLALPLRPDLGRDDIDRVCDAIQAFYGGGA
ncbi:DegT/DnrJ/EryC1/StrS family aminotransferase [Saccharopolyspora phatthalungensis]|uniref:dTDP-4-amino-4,6-dideoxygalactose transaminase n=1 Tax=Saccharopolyspora phatthalungensis TaxID=664693 RepID=A0A840QFG8_9PSEU|nr:DegT/DnrJ/EryC1/StrS family aminotransferase [Saccharopolyspora phatthalungensis]MBB5157225.1 dTDP-4-amino-4,6-dideoxygalactose transaminase [Saccharopolyspora phatthalungensis]